mmetsp:Transcript_3358/g.5516  ORF Transcript_3358/g.5516 Transcript_3358/m.5516 type:complete len:477 (-) Transcript_3358:334-1764(-)
MDDVQGRTSSLSTHAEHLSVSQNLRNHHGHVRASATRRRVRVSNDRQLAQVVTSARRRRLRVHLARVGVDLVELDAGLQRRRVARQPGGRLGRRLALTAGGLGDDVEEDLLERRVRQRPRGDRQALLGALELAEDVRELQPFLGHVPVGRAVQLVAQGRVRHQLAHKVDHLRLPRDRRRHEELVPAVEPDAQLCGPADGPHEAEGHDADPVAERLGLLKRVGGEDEALVLLGGLHRVPQLAPRLRVEPGRWLVEQDHLRVADEGAGHGETALHAARVGARAARHLESMVEVDSAQPVQDLLRDRLFGHATHPSEELQVLSPRQVFPEQIVLCADAHGAVDLLQVSPQVEGRLAAAEHSPIRRGVQPAEDVDRRRLACAVGTKKAEALPVVDAELHVDDRGLLRAVVNLREAERAQPASLLVEDSGSLSRDLGRFTGRGGLGRRRHVAGRALGAAAAALEEPEGVQLDARADGQHTV